MSTKVKSAKVALKLARKPMARATRVTLFEREVKERLSTAAVELLLERAEVLAEGKRSDSTTAQRAFFGSIMMTLDLATIAPGVRETCDATTATRVAEMMDADARVQKRIRQIAEREASRLAGAQIRIHAGDVRIRADGARVFVDVDVEE